MTKSAHILVPAMHVRGDSGNRCLRTAVQENLVSFPAQVPVFHRQSRPDIQGKIAVLYFIRGWPLTDIAKKYSLASQLVVQIASRWRLRALSQDYIQVIDTEGLAVRIGQQGLPDNAKAISAAASASEAVEPPERLAVQAVRVHDARSPQPVTEPAKVSESDLVPTCNTVLVEKLEAITAVLENQLRLHFRTKASGAADACGQLVERADSLCSLLTSKPLGGVASDQSCDERRIVRVSARARAVILHFRERRFEHSPFEPGAALARTGRTAELSR